MAVRPSSPRGGKHRAPKPGRPKGKFTQHRRLDRLRDLLESEPRGLTLAEIAAGLNVTPRSVRRYLRELDGTSEHERFETLEAIETVPGGPQVWRIKPGERGRAVPMRRAQAYGVLATRRQFDVFRGSALYDEIDLALTQIAKVAQTPFRTATKAEISGEHALEERFFFVPPPARTYGARGEDVDELFRAVADLRVLRYRPRSRPGEPAGSRVTFLPYAMVVHDGNILVLGARASSPGEVETVRLDAMADVRTSETERFDLPAWFDVEQYVHGELGVGPPAKGRFVVEFDARVAEDVRTRRLHAQQKLFTAPDGRVRVSLPLVDARAAIAWVLSWGEAARLVDPPELAAEIAVVLARAAARYR